METKIRFAGIVLLGLGFSCQAGSPAPPADGDALHRVQAGTLALPSHSVSSTTWSPQEGLVTLLARAQAESPRVLSAVHAWQAKAARVDQASALPDPWLSLGAYLQAVETRNGPMDGRVGINQSIPWPGKLETAGDRASSLADAAHWGIEEARLKVRSTFLKVWTEMAYLQQAIDITKSQVVLLQHIEDVSLRLYESSRVSQADVLRAQVERLEMEDRLATLQQKTSNLIPRLEQLLGSRMSQDAIWTGVKVPGVPDLASPDLLKSRFQDHSPAMIRLSDEMRASQAERKLAELEDRPDLAVGADWTWIGQGNAVSPDAGDDAFSLSLAVELPIQRGRIDAARREAMANQKRVLASLEETRWGLTADLDEALSDLADAERRMTLYRDRLLPKGQETYETTLVAYQSGQSGFQEMLDAARVILDFRLAAVRASSDAHLAFAVLNGLLPAHELIAEESER
ncbi:MAG: TolC family protein [Planctomycetota bacterium]